MKRTVKLLAASGLIAMLGIAGAGDVSAEISYPGGGKWDHGTSQVS